MNHTMVFDATPQDVGFYWISFKNSQSSPLEVAYWNGTNWNFAGTAKKPIDAVVVESPRLIPPK